MASMADSKKSKEPVTARKSGSARSAAIVDDSPVSRAAVRECLNTLGMTVVGEAADTGAGFHLFEQTRPDLVTVDLVMPQTEGMSTLDLVRSIKSLSRNTVVIAISTIPFESTQQKIIEAGASAYIAKPVTADKLRAVLSGTGTRKHPA